MTSDKEEGQVNYFLIELAVQHSRWLPNMRCEVGAGLVILGTDESDPVTAAAALARSAPQPPLLKAGIADSKAVLRHFLLLHDASSGVTRAEWALLQLIKSKLPSDRNYDVYHQAEQIGLSSS